MLGRMLAGTERRIDVDLDPIHVFLRYVVQVIVQSALSAFGMVLARLSGGIHESCVAVVFEAMVPEVPENA